MGVPYGDEFEKVTMAEAVLAWRRRGYYVIHTSELTQEQREAHVDLTLDDGVQHGEVRAGA